MAKEEEFSWLRLKGKGIALPFILITVVFLALTLLKGMVTSLLDGMDISITINYLYGEISIIQFLFWALYVAYFMQFLERVVGLIGELIRFAVWVVYFYFWFQPFGIVMLKVSIPDMADIALSIDIFYVIIFFLVIMVINQIFKTRIQLLKRTNDEFLEENPPNIAQKIIGGLCFAFAMYWVTGLFGLLPVPVSYMSYLSPYLIMLINTIVGLINSAMVPLTFDADMMLAIHQVLFVVLGFLIFGILGKILGPKKKKADN
jgi:hypothetical protein